MKSSLVQFSRAAAMLLYIGLCVSALEAHAYSGPYDTPYGTPYSGPYAYEYQYQYETPGLTFTDNVTAAKTFAVGSTLAKSGGTFLIDHPLDPANKLLYHSFVESPDAKNIYDGVAELDENGEA